MEENKGQEAPNGKSTLSPMIIAGIVGIIIILAVVGYVLAKKISKSSVSTNQMESAPTTVMVQEKTQGSNSAIPNVAEGSKTEEKTEGAVKAFEIDGSNYKFTPNVLKVNEGDSVRITFKNTQGMHNFMIDEFNAKSKTISTGETDELSFVASKKGTFEFYCSVGKHRAMGMVGTLTVM